MIGARRSATIGPSARRLGTNIEAATELQRGRDAYARGAWRDAHALLARADRSAPLRADDLELLATAAYMLGRDDEWMGHLERAHRRHVEAREPLRAARCAFWVGMNLALRGEVARASGWLGRARRLLERHEGDCVEWGYLQLPVSFRHEVGGDFDAAAASAAAAAETAERFGDGDLFALAVHQQGQILVRHGRVDEGLSLLDEAMVAVTAGELSPIVTGLVYCGVIAGCQAAYELRRAQEWTTALTRWCERQPDLVAFTGRCLVHRAEILQLRGDWRDALREARSAGERLARGPNRAAAADAFYRQGELHRLRGRAAAAEEAYRTASRHGCEPQPGLALLRLAQGNVAAAAAAIRRATDETTEPLRRAGLLPAYVEITLAAGDDVAAAAGARELEALAGGYGHEHSMLGALADQARGAVELAGGDARTALVALRRAWRRWEGLDVPYEAARVRVLVGMACRALGDEDSAALEFDAARGAFERLGAAPDVDRVDGLSRPAEAGGAHGLTARELQVLRLVAAGATNRAIAAELVLSERTVDRHVSNIFAKLRVSSRTAAAAFAYEHGLV